MHMQTPADLLALIPSLINREPKEVLVLITIKDNQMQCALGMEHYDEEQGDITEYVAAIVSQMTELKPESLIMVFYTDREPDADGMEPYFMVNMLVMLTLDMLTPMHVNPGILVKGDKYRVFGADHWHDMEEAKESELAAAMVLNGMRLEPTGLVIPEPISLTDEVAQAIDDAVANVPEYPHLIQDAWAMPYVLEVRALYEELLQRGFGATEEEAVRIIACFQEPLIRDRLMVDTISSTMDPIEFGNTITGSSDARPNPDRVDAAISLLDNLMQWTNDKHRMPLLVGQAWLAWMSGRNMDAEEYLGVAEATDPTYRMATMFRRYIRDLKRIPDSIAHGEGR